MHASFRDTDSELTDRSMVIGRIRDPAAATADPDPPNLSAIGQTAGKWPQKAGTSCGLRSDSGAGTAKPYQHCKRLVNLTRHLHDLTDPEFAALIVSQLKGCAQEAVDIFGLEDLEGVRGLQMVRQILDQDPGKLSHDRLH